MERRMGRIDIQELINNLNLISGVIPDYSEGRTRGLSDDESENVALEAVAQAIEALEKQIPKKVKIINHGTVLCPDCMDDVFSYYSYCPECGQKLDWED